MAHRSFIKLFVRPGSKHRDFDDNEILALRSFDYGLIELVFWHGLFEIYYRPLSKRYGYFVASFYDLDEALGFLKLPRLDLGRFLPGLDRLSFPGSPSPTKK